jgi:aminoglycoside 2'-N-acetyltransferase I
MCLKCPAVVDSSFRLMAEMNTMPDDLTIRTARTAELDAATRRVVIDVCLAAHNEPDFENLFRYLPPDGLHILGYLGERLVSHAVLTTRWLQPEGYEILNSAWVDAVATLPEEQGRGYGSAVMRHLAAVIAPDYEIAGLHTDDKQHFYAQVDWELWRGALAGRGENDELVFTPEQQGIMILRLPHTPPLNLDGLLTIEISGRIW